MLTKFGSGRFCSRACANSREQTEEMCWKKSATLRGVSTDKWTLDEYSEFKKNQAENTKKRPTKEEVNGYLSDIIPAIEKGTNKKGWQSRNVRYSYPEKFWKQVLENNNVDYIHGEYVHNERTGIHAAVYELDFLIDGKYDIEIDGGTHTKFEDVKQKDVRRDAYLTSLGYIVYRIP